ncbi:MAG: hypothetical protein GY679_01585 [Mycoplasma sp.]|nr:hypothetical protein [Mycoplasma sp.]
MIWYSCYNCGEHSGNMKLLKERYEPSERESRENPQTAGELLQCTCGKVLRWLEMKEGSWLSHPMIINKGKGKINDWNDI